MNITVWTTSGKKILSNCVKKERHRKRQKWETVRKEFKEEKAGRTERQRKGKWSGSREARPPHLSLCGRACHCCTSWALAVAFEVLWGTSSHETSIVNPLVNQVCSWAYVWGGSFSLEDLKHSKRMLWWDKKRWRSERFWQKQMEPCQRFPVKLVTLLPTGTKGSLTL